MNPYKNGRQTSRSGSRYEPVPEPIDTELADYGGAAASPIQPEPAQFNSDYHAASRAGAYHSPSGPQHAAPYRAAPVAPPAAPRAPWDAHAFAAPPFDAADVADQSAASLNTSTWDEHALLSAQQRPAPQRRSSFASSIRRYLDPESQATRMSRSSSRRYMFGLQRVPTISEYDDEYADDEGGDFQIPVHGDEYQLNTWDTAAVSQYAQPSHPDPRALYATDFAEEHDFGSGYADYAGYEGSLRDGDAPQSWPEEDLVSEKAEDDDASDEDGDEKRLRTVNLFKGNLVLDCPVSTKLLEQYPEHTPVREFTHMRYTAATCDPADFVDEEYTLRQMCYAQPRQTELFICVTIYNEDDILLARTLQGIFNNVRHLCHRDRSSTWGPEAWKKIVVCVVADGRDKMHPRAKALMAALGVYQEGFAKNMVNDKSVQAHLYEYTSMVRIKSVSDKHGVKLTAEKGTPVQLMFCMKEKNQRKINSHRWFFQAFGRVLNPNICVLVDAGTRPGNHAIYHLWKSFRRDPQVAGACGEIAAMLGTGGRKLLNPIVAAQNFEYKMSNIMDKPSESIFGFITVLPGAFSAYRYEALQNHPNGTGPLEKYFKGEKQEGRGGVFQANMYLAEDRILCWELVSKRNSNWILRYVKSAKAHTDVPEGLSELVLQRRRWLNGSFFAQVYSLAHGYAIWGSGHSVIRKLALHLQFAYQTITLLFSWFSLANFFLVFHILASALGDKSAQFAPGQILGIVLTWVYAACLLTVFILSFGNRPQGTRKFYTVIVVFFAAMMAYMVFATVYISVKSIEYAICANNGFSAKLLWTNSTFRDLLISLMATYALYLLVSLLFMDPWHILTSMFQYVILSPVYINVLNVYAFCNTHDISWGTKGDTAQRLDLGIVRANDAGKVELELPTSAELVDTYYLNEINLLSEPPGPEAKSEPSESDKRADYYALFRTLVVLAWVLMNLALVGVVLNIGGFQALIGGKDGANSSGPSSSTGTGSGSGTGSGTGSGSSTGSGTGNGITGSLGVRSVVEGLLLRAADAGVCHEITTGGSIVSKVYMAVVLWSVCFMAAYRFVFCVIYMILWLFRQN